MFGVVFPNRSFPMDISAFSQIDTFHWVLDMNTFVGEAYHQIREMCIFLLNNFTLPPDKALAVYIQSPGSQFLFCGAVTLARPSAVLSLPWPEPGGQMQLIAADSAPISAKIGVSVEDLASLQSLDVTAGKRIERLALKVGENLFNFMQSFCGVDGSKLVVPMDILDRWFKKFQEKAKRDPEYLKGFVFICLHDRLVELLPFTAMAEPFPAENAAKSSIAPCSSRNLALSGSSKVDLICIGYNHDIV
ncbi:Protein Hikeshi, partial [Cucurbita argyrosperma subsp. sororia]